MAGLSKLRKFRFRKETNNAAILSECPRAAGDNCSSRGQQGHTQS
uniref:Uncharacterized protein n=1 Tax=Terrapene triunguis TaxID=2587831 RepID=A0A674JCF0_9SAUR